MLDNNIERKIAVIFATDVVGYSKHMEVNEVATVKSLRAFEEIFKDLLNEHNARLFNTGGDSFLAEFPSALSAVACAVSFQSAVKTFNDNENGLVALQFRIGINSGDVIKEKSNFLGEGVNIASRLEALALPGGITISKTIYEYVKGKIDLEFYDLGIQKVKQNEFHAIDILLPGLSLRKQKGNPSSKRNSFFIMILVGFVGIISLCSVYILPEGNVRKTVLKTLGQSSNQSAPETRTTDSIRNHFMNKLSQPTIHKSEQSTEGIRNFFLQKF